MHNKFLITLLLFASSSYGAVVIDQSVDLYPASAAFGVNGIERAQTFTVGTAGLLTAIDLRVVSRFDPASFVLTLYNVNNGRPLEGGFANKAFSGSIFPEAIINADTGGVDNFEWISLDISDLGIAVNQGDMLAFGLGESDLTASGSFTINMNLSSPSNYPGGVAFIRDVDPDNYLYQFYPTWTEQASNSDIVFRTQVSVVPVPPALALFASGLLVLSGLKRKVATGKLPKAFSPNQMGQPFAIAHSTAKRVRRCCREY